MLLWEPRGRVGRVAPSAALAAAEEQEARRQAFDLGDVVFEGLQPGEPRAGKMGVFALTKPLKMVSRRAVWQAADGRDVFAFFGSGGRWIIGLGENMRAGNDMG